MSDWRPYEPMKVHPPYGLVRYIDLRPTEWRPFEPCRDAESRAQRERDKLETQAETARRRAAGLPCEHTVIRHVAARYRSYGPCNRLAGHPGYCSNESCP